MIQDATMIRPITIIIVLTFNFSFNKTWKHLYNLELENHLNGSAWNALQKIISVTNK